MCSIRSLHTSIHQPHHESNVPVNDKDRLSLRALILHLCVELIKGLLSKTQCYPLYYHNRKQAAWSQPVCLLGDFCRNPSFTPTLWLSHQLAITPGCPDPMLQQLPGSTMAFTSLINWERIQSSLCG